MDKDPTINLDLPKQNPTQRPTNKSGLEKRSAKGSEERSIVQKKERTASINIKSLEEVNHSNFTFAFFNHGLFNKSELLKTGNAHQLLSVIEEKNGLDIDEPILLSLPKDNSQLDQQPEANIIMFLSMPKLDDPNSVNPWLSYLLDVIESWHLSEISLYSCSEIYSSEKNSRSTFEFLERVIETLFSNSRLTTLNWITSENTKIQVLNAGLFAKKKLSKANTLLTVYH
ncbi:MAG: hypothetical protein KBD78_01805 [Oligoflexales bacterium]|nr:hypothetical protein [Oligoflexales bacterium]